MSGLLGRKIKFPLHRIYFYWTRSCLKVDWFTLFFVVSLLMLQLRIICCRKCCIYGLFLSRICNYAFFGVKFLAVIWLKFSEILRILAEILRKNWPLERNLHYPANRTQDLLHAYSAVRDHNWDLGCGEAGTFAG